MSKIKVSTIVRTVVLCLALVNQCLTMADLSPLPIEDAQVENLLTNVFTIAASLWAWWKNNSFTPAAIEADKVLEDLKKTA